jgi:hypothetical protein
LPTTLSDLLEAKMSSVVPNLKMVSVELPNTPLNGKSSFNGVFSNSPICCGQIRGFGLPFREELEKEDPSV